MLANSISGCYPRIFAPSETVFMKYIEGKNNEEDY